jgi:hypothetical protein
MKNLVYSDIMLPSFLVLEAFFAVAEGFMRRFSVAAFDLGRIKCLRITEKR